MSVMLHVIWLECDAEGCEEQFEYVGARVRDARDLARQFGWSSNGRTNDLCDTHTSDAESSSSEGDR